MGEIQPDREGFREVCHIDPEAGVYNNLVLRDGRIVGAILMNDRRDLGTISQLMARQIDVSPHADGLLSGEFDLRSLLKT